MDDKGNLALYLACIEGYVDVTKVLIKKGAVGGCEVYVCMYSISILGYSYKV